MSSPINHIYNAHEFLMDFNNKWAISVFYMQHVTTIDPFSREVFVKRL